MKKSLFITLAIFLLLSFAAFAAPEAVITEESAEETNTEFGEPDLSEPAATEDEIPGGSKDAEESTAPEVSEESEVDEETVETEATEETAELMATYTYGDLTYTISNSTVTITDCSASATNVTIPSRINGYPVTSIGSSAFYNCTSLESVVIPDSVRYIYEYAFFGCTSLKSIGIPDSVTSIGSAAFCNCISLESITVDENNQKYSSDEYGVLYDTDKTILIQYPIGNERASFEIPSGVTIISKMAFYNCTSLESVVIPDSVTSIGERVFDGCKSLKSVVIPDSVTSIGSSAFNGCKSLESVIIGEGVTSIGDKTFYNCTSLESVIIGEGVTSIGDKTFYNCTSLKSVVIPDSVTSIGEDAFYKCTSLERVVIPDGVTNIGDRVFYNCTSLESIEIPDSVTSIGFSAFCDCTSLVDIKIPDGVTSIGSTTFSNCTSLVSVEIPYGVTSIGERAFGGCKSLVSVEIPYGVTSIGERVFDGCKSLKSVVIPDSVTSIGDKAFNDCTNLESVVIPDSVTSIGSSAFNDCTNLESVVIPDSVTSIGSSAFRGCTNLESVVIPDSVTSIGSSAFNGCKSLESVVIPDSVTRIGLSAFYGCTSLESVVIPDSVTSIGNYAFQNCTSLESVEIPDSVTSIGNYAFSSCTSLESVVIPDGVTNIGYRVFYNCTSLESVEIPDSVTSIGVEAFCSCTSLESVVIPDSVTSIGEEAFYDCTSLEEMTLPFVGAKRGVSGTYDSVFGYIFGHTSYKVGGTTKQYYSSGSSDYYYYYIPSSLKKVTITDDTTLPYGAFYGCTNLTSIEMPDSVTSIGTYAFSGCESLESVYYTSDVEAWCNISFEDNPLNNGADLYLNNEKLQHLVIPDSITNISSLLFRGCTSIESVVIPDSVTSIGKYAFQDCTSLESVIIGEGVTSIGEYAFDDCTGLESVTIGEGVTSIGEYAFYDCTSLESVYYTSDVEAWCSISFANQSSNPLYNKADLYLNNEMLQHLVIPDGITNVSSLWFQGCSSLESVEIPDSVTSIGSSAFYNCSSLESVYYTSDVEAWCSISFANQSSNPLYNKADLYLNNEKLRHLVISGRITNISPLWFRGCTSIESVVIPDSVTSIGDYVFENCESLESVTIPHSMTAIGNMAFNGCTSLEDVYYYGLQSHWVKIPVGLYNAPLNSAEIHYNGVHITGVNLDKSSVSMVPGDNITLSAIVYPDDACDNSVSWSTSDSSVATVVNGSVMAISVGTATISVTTNDGGFRASCEIQVKEAPPLTRDIVLVLDNSGSMEGTPIEKLKEVAIEFCTLFDKRNANENEVNRVAIVVYSGKVESCDFTTNLSTLTSMIEEMDGLSKDGTLMNKGLDKAYDLMKKSVADEKAVLFLTDGEPTCETSDVKISANSVKKVADLYTLGFFHSLTGTNKNNAVSLLNAIQNAGYYEAKNSNDLDEAFSDVLGNITKPLVDSIVLEKEEMYLMIGETQSINYSLLPYNATNRNIKWSSSDPFVAFVSENGMITAISEGTATITASSEDGGCKTKCIVIVNSPYSWYYTYTVDEGCATITGFRPELPSEIDIPLFVENHPVIAIGESAFAGSSFTNISISDSVKQVHNSAFKDCELLESVKIPESVTDIALSAFDGCERVTIYGYENTKAETYAKQNSIPFVVVCKGEHVYDNGTVIKESTCTEKGYKNYFCSKCNNKKTVELELKEHPYGDWTVTTEPTCTEVGEKKILCTACDDVKETAVVSALGHNHVYNSTEDATCTEAGYDLHICTRCKNEKRIEIPAKGHSWSAWEVTKEPTWKEKGIKTRVCDVCGEIENRDVDILPYVDVTAISLNKSSINLVVGYSVALVATIKPEDASEKDVVWTSSDESVASVDENGVVTAHKAGEVEITATSHNGNKAICLVTTGEPATGVELSSLKATSVAVGKTLTLKGKAVRDDNMKPVSTAVVFEILEGEEFATLDANGKLTAIAEGEVLVRISPEAGTVDAYEDIIIKVCVPATKVILNKTKAGMSLGYGDLELSATLVAKEECTDTLTWSVDKPEIATVDENGVVTAHATGKVKVTAMAGSGKKATCTVTIGEPATKVDLTALKTTSLAVGKTITLKGKAARDDKVKPVSTAVVFEIIDGEEYATIDAKGKLTGKKIGEVVVRVRAEAGTDDAYEDVIINVCIPATKVTLNMTKASMIVGGEDLCLEATMTPFENTDTLTWSVDKPEIATVEDGIVTAHSAGKVKVTAASGSGKKATCTITVGEPATKVEVTALKVTSVAFGKSITLKGKAGRDDNVKPVSTAVVFEIIEDEDLATIDAKGKLTANKEGNEGDVVVRIRAEAGTEDAYEDVIIRVCNLATKVTLNMNKATIAVDDELQLKATMSPDDNTDTIMWSVDKDSIATVDENGLVTAHSAGKVKVTATSGSGKKATCTITVTK